MVADVSRYCGECGAQLRQEAAFCAQCGQSNAPRLDQSEDRPSFYPSDALPRSKHRNGILKKLVLSAIVIALPFWGIDKINGMRETYGADSNFDGYITPKEVRDYAAKYEEPWVARGIWRFKPLTMYGSSEMRHIAERLDTMKEADFLFSRQIYNSLQLGDQDILPLRMDQCLITKYNVTRSREGGESYNGISGPYNMLDVELDCSSHAPKGKRLNARVSITHNDNCMKGLVDYDDETGNVTESSYIEGEFIGYKDDSCLGNENFVKSNIYYPQVVWLGFELTRGLRVIENGSGNFFIINRHLNAESEDRRRKNEAVRAKENAAKQAALAARCPGAPASDMECAAYNDANRALDAAAAAAEKAAQRVRDAGGDAQSAAEAAADAAAARM